MLGNELAADQPRDFERWRKLVRTANLTGQ
jgi:hypothetical protein